jgi:hypothetical protein
LRTAWIRIANDSMIAVTENPMTMAVTTSADGIGSTARAGCIRDALSIALSMIGAVPPVT